jgi:hypothetical protein
MSFRLAIVLFALVVISVKTVAQEKPMYLPRPDGRWEVLVPDVQIDTETIKFSTLDNGDRWTNVWLRYVSNSGSLMTVYWGGSCSQRKFTVYESVSKDVGGKENISSHTWGIPLHPGSDWEPSFTALCKRAKQWWKVW